MKSIFEILSDYVTGLDWAYIMSFILIAYLVNYVKVRAGIEKVLKLKAHTRYRVALTGILLGTLIFFICLCSWRDANVYGSTSIV